MVDSKTKTGSKTARKPSRKARVVRQMKSLGVYDASYLDLIEIYAGLLDQYDMMLEEFKRSGCQITEEYTNKAGATNQRKVPVLTAMESLRKDIASYSDRLLLNPKVNSVDVVQQVQTNPLDAFMRSRGGDGK